MHNPDSVSQGRIVVGMSGGVDSAVAALLLTRAGHDVHGLFMTNWEEDEEGYCSAAADFQDARQVCAELGIPLHRVNFAREYRERVFSHFLAEYRAGRTPNPDVFCNREIKFGVFRDYAMRLGADLVATGHYARLTHEGRRCLLRRGADAGKDQSYFLSAVPQSRFANAMFPLGEMTKQTVRELARQAGLPVFDKKDSTGICFIGERKFRDFLGRYLPAQPGDIEDPDGEVIGRHQGLMYYTLGQRQGLGIGGIAGAAEAAWYVAGKDLTRNVLHVVQGHDHPALLAAGACATDASWVAGRPPGDSFRCTVKLRYRQKDQSCRLTLQPDGGLRLTFERPQRAVTPGQFAVFYLEDVCLGAAVISQPLTTIPEQPTAHVA